MSIDRLIVMTDAQGFITLHEPDEDGKAGDMVASVWRDDWLTRLTKPMTPEPAQPAEAWLNDPASLESGEPAQPAESPEARALCSKAVAAAIKATEYKYFGDYEMSDDQRESVDVLVEVARRYFAATTARPTERGAVEALREIDALINTLHGSDRARHDALAKSGKIVSRALAQPATDQAGEMEAGERVADAVHGELWKADDEIKRLRNAMNEIDVLAGTTLPSDGPEAAFAALEGIIKLIHPFRINAAALDTQTATGRAKGGEGALNRIRASMAMLQQHSEGCAINHYGGDFQEHGMPGWLIDTKADLQALTDHIAALQNGGE